MATAKLTPGQRQYAKRKARLASDPEYAARRRTIQRASSKKWDAKARANPEYREQRLIQQRNARRSDPERRKAQYRAQSASQYAREREEMLRTRKFPITGKRKNQIRQRAKEKDRVFAIEGLVLDIPERCPLTGIPLDGRDLKHTPSIDRVNNELGYIETNVWIVSWWANNIKRRMDVETAKRRLARLVAANDNSPEPEAKAA